MALPWLIGAAVVGTAAYLMSDSDSSSSTSSDESERREEKRKERQAKERQDIKKEIKTYKQQAKQRIKNKYNTDIEFSSHNVKVRTQYSEEEVLLNNAALVAAAASSITGAYLGGKIRDEINPVKVNIGDNTITKQIEDVERDNTTLSSLLQKLEDQYHATKS
jgi:gas vesicle protein